MKFHEIFSALLAVWLMFATAAILIGFAFIPACIIGLSAPAVIYTVRTVDFLIVIKTPNRGYAWTTA